MMARGHDIVLIRPRKSDFEIRHSHALYKKDDACRCLQLLSQWTCHVIQLTKYSAKRVAEKSRDCKNEYAHTST